MQKNQYIEAVERLTEWDRAYHVQDRPVVSDSEYDALFREVKKAEELHPDWLLPDSPTQRVGGEPLDKFEKGEHPYPLLSLSNAYDEGELQDFLNRVHRGLPPETQASWYAETKFDGLSVALHYEEGRLIQALTRGDGRTGEVITHNVRTIRSLPLVIQDRRRLVLRAEILLPRREFEKVNQRQEEAGLLPFANPRNAAAGTMRQLDPKMAHERRLDCFLYDVMNREELELESHSKAMEFLHRQGFQIDPRGRMCQNAEELNQFYQEVFASRHDLAYDIDGIVIKLDSYRFQDILGYTGKSPRFAVAYKYAPDQAQTRILGIEVQVGRTGVLTPVAVFEPTLLAGSTIQHATLHNWQEMREKDIRIGDQVIIEKAGDIIPQVVRVLTEAREAELEELPLPEICPVCKGEVIQREGEVAYRCINESCSSRLLQAMKHFVSRDALDIQGVGESVLEQLLGKGLLETPWDLFGLEVDDFLSLKETKERLATKLYDAVLAKKTAPLPRVLFALGLPHVGVQSARVLASHFLSYQKILDASIDEIAEIDGFGAVMAEAIHARLHSEGFLHWEEKRREFGVVVEDIEIQEGTDGPLNQQIICFTGKLYRMGRTQAQEVARGLGARTVDSITKETTLLVAGEKAGSKLKKAEKLGIEILSEEDFFQRIGQ